MFKGFTLTIVAVIIMLIGPAYLMVFTSDDYDRQCKMSIAVPCIGVE